MIMKIVHLIKKIIFSSMELDNGKVLAAQSSVERVKKHKVVASLADIEFKVFSQWGEDGIIQYLINKIDIKEKIFIEFGAAKYLESNTRFLAINNYWKGLLFDGSKKNIKFIKNDDVYWKYGLYAKQAFIDKDNINELIQSGLKQLGHNKNDIGLLSIDIDGNDYWVWKSIDVINPAIVVCEYNSLFGSKYAVTIPYDAKFIRTKAHYSLAYAGASLAALCDLAKKKGYSFVGSNSAGNNCFFVKTKLAKSLKIPSCKAGYRKNVFKETKNSKGQFSFVAPEQALRDIGNKVLIDVKKNKSILIKDLFQDKEEV